MQTYRVRRWLHDGERVSLTMENGRVINMSQGAIYSQRYAIVYDNLGDRWLLDWVPRLFRVPRVQLWLLSY